VGCVRQGRMCGRRCGLRQDAEVQAKAGDLGRGSMAAAAAGGDVVDGEQ
jgi:hypothetical protein